MDNHLHIVMRLDPCGAKDFSDEEVARRWLQAFPASWDWTDENAVPEIDEQRLEKALGDEALIAKWRDRLEDLGWCLKALKEPISRRCNKEDHCTGAFWQSRFKSVLLLDQSALISCMAYVDLNPIRACMAATPEQSDYTGIQDRIDLRQLFEKSHGLRSHLRKGSPAQILIPMLSGDSKPLHSPEADLWLTPIKACMTGDWGVLDNGLNPDDYFTLLEETGRIIRDDKRGSISRKLSPILKRLSLDVQAWVQCMCSPKQMMGAALGHIKSRSDEATRRGVQWVRNRCALFNSA
jgi:hypothetical protein